MLISYGADVQQADLEHDNCLHYAVTNPKYEIIEYLLNATCIDPCAKNFSQLNAVCSLIAGADESEEKFRCFCILFERSYEKDSTTQNYNIKEIFLPMVLSALYSSSIADYIIHNVYSKENSKYELIKKLEEIPIRDQVALEFRYYLYAFTHDKIIRYHLYKYRILNQIDKMAVVSSFKYFIGQSLQSDDANKTVLEFFEHLNSIGFNNKFEPICIQSIENLFHTRLFGIIG
jgi:hypothetical protein